MYAPIEQSVSRTAWSLNLASSSRTTKENIGITISAGRAGADEELVRRVLTRSRARVAAAGEDSAQADYVLGDMIGQGGMGQVYAARQVALERTVAVKIMREEMRDDWGARSKFLAEALVASELEHPNTAPVYDIGLTQSGVPFYSMKLVSGTPWTTLLPGYSLDDNLRTLLMVSDAVAYAHDRGIIHRDIKPANVMIGAYGEVLLMDWGLATGVGNPRARPLDQNSVLSGTPAYMPPEVAHCDLDKIGPTSDIYLLGGILFEIVTGRRPHSAESVLLCLDAAMRNELQRTDQTDELLDVALVALRAEPDERYASVRDFQTAVRDYLAHAQSLAVARQGWQRFEQLPEQDQEDIYRECNEIIAIFKQALVAWPGNRLAGEGLVQVRQTLAGIALRRGEVQLARSHSKALDQECASYQLPLRPANAVAERIKASVGAQDREARRNLGYG